MTGDHLIHYQDRGEGSPVVLLHGLGGSSSAWMPNLRSLSEHFRVFAPDLPGAGLSDYPQVDYSLEFFADFLHEFLDYLGIDNCTLVGNSLGGAIAVEFASRFPERVSALVLEDCAGLGSELDPALKPAVLNSFDREGLEKLFKLLFHDPKFIIPAAIEETLRCRSRPGAKDALTKLTARHLGDDGQKVTVKEKLAGLDIPVLLVWGLHDSITPPEQGMEAAKLLADGELITFEHSGHCPHIEEAEKYNREVLRFLRSASKD